MQRKKIFILLTCVVLLCSACTNSDTTDIEIVNDEIDVVEEVPSEVEEEKPSTSYDDALEAVTQEEQEILPSNITGLENVYAEFYYMGMDQIGYMDEANQFIIYSLITGEITHTLECSNENIFSQNMSYIENGVVVYGIGMETSLIGTAYADIYYWDGTSRHIEFEEYLSDATYANSPIRYSKGEDKIFYISSDNQLKIYDIDTNESIGVCMLGDLRIVETACAWDESYVAFSGKMMLSDGSEQNGFGSIDLADGQIYFYEDDDADNRLMASEEGIFVDMVTALAGEVSSDNIYKILSDGYERVQIENGDTADKVNVSLSGAYFTTQSEGTLTVYEVGNMVPIASFIDSDYGANTISTNALILDERKEILCTYTDENGIRNYCYSY